MMNIKEIKKFIEMAREYSLSEFEIEQEGIRLRIKWGGTSSLSHTAQDEMTVPVSSASKEPSTAEESNLNQLSVVKSPIVGTYYSAPDPKEPPFVKVGDKVRQGQVLCIVEAMKLMNEIDSEYDGEIVDIHMENGQAVQYGDPLFSIKPVKADS